MPTCDPMTPSTWPANVWGVLHDRYSTTWAFLAHVDGSGPDDKPEDRWCLCTPVHVYDGRVSGHPLQLEALTEGDPPEAYGEIRAMPAGVLTAETPQELAEAFGSGGLVGSADDHWSHRQQVVQSVQALLAGM